MHEKKINMNLNIGIIGSGAFGTSLSLYFCNQNHKATLYTLSDHRTKPLLENRVNDKYLPHHTLPETLEIVTSIDDLEKQDIVIVALPVSAIIPFFEKHIEHFKKMSGKIILAAKGFLPHEYSTSNFIFLADYLLHRMGLNAYVLSGPNFASEIAEGKISASTLAGYDEDETLKISQALSSSYWRIYPSNDVMGVSFCGAAKNVYAIASGIAFGLDCGQNTLSALLTRSLAEMKRLGVKLGAQESTFLGLSGVGDMILTCSSTQSRNMKFGLELSKGKSVNDALKFSNGVVEGYKTCQRLFQLSQEYNVHMPIVNSIYGMLYENQDLKTAIIKITDLPLKTYENQ
ncbi:MAG: hypothetical protein C0432_05340 [Candidatus Puniceispirillum sp.]|nr:hypothetical protein [Candidatus Pelagibacter sp.]MBA4283699.1 hypothetical protein [Candidatus Puniceispirillum sp.]